MSDTPTPTTPGTGVTPEQAERLIVLVTGLSTGIEESNRQIGLSNQAIAQSNDRIGELGTSVKVNAANVRKVRAWQVITIIGLVLDLTLSAGYFYNLAQTNHAVNANKASLRISCMNGNNVRADDVLLWGHVEALQPAATSAEKAADAAFIAFVDNTFKPQVCPS